MVPFSGLFSGMRIPKARKFHISSVLLWNHHRISRMFSRGFETINYFRFFGYGILLLEFVETQKRLVDFLDGKSTFGEKDWLILSIYLHMCVTVFLCVSQNEGCKDKIHGEFTNYIQWPSKHPISQNFVQTSEMRFSQVTWDSHAVPS